MKNYQTLANELKIMLGIVFIASSLLKVVSIRTFAMETGDYIDLYMPQWLHGWNMPCAIGVCASELLVGLLAFWRKHVRWMSILSLVMLTFFVWLTGVNLFFPTVFGSVESCGCFGELVHFTPVGSFVKSVVLWLLALVLFVVVITDRKHV
ncbi:hypothetical protein HMPREF1981_00592 [Bacteroides pyogenes F0041]|uniref:Methylamine utilisation protein MauE domain-containing protein n=1 Tax=Bacteroides pyogenes F0041 TaxID=1321819 RepID=U2CVY8_9BACE|nr:MauE/DoxX family redox-associated membrane protein [Bacteroides pyogenes]ERI88208.1 hypothetical protein HMPREF1981_00592 [Bacteroides pyogenes F0041]